MNKKLLVVSILAVFMLVAISLTSAVSSNEVKTVVEKKESPLFGIRTRQAIKEKLGEIIENIKTKYIGERLFFLPFQLIRNGDVFSVRNRLAHKDTWNCRSSEAKPCATGFNDLDKSCYVPLCAKTSYHKITCYTSGCDPCNFK